MLDFLRDVLSSDRFMPHGHCYLWKPGLLWLQVISNSLIGLSYVAISLTLAYLVKKGDYVPFKGMALAFGVFIVSCGLTHFMDVLVIWEPAYWADGVVRAVTALASVSTACLLPPLVPRAVRLAQGAKAAHERGIELQAAMQDLGTLYERTKELDELKTQFFANVSHELRTPLALILGPTQALLASNLDPDQRRHADLILKNARALLKHVNDLLDVSRLEADKLKPRYTTVDLAALVRIVAGHFSGLATERNMQFVVDAPGPLRAELDSSQIQRVVLNLLSNAFKFTTMGGRIRCTLRASDDGRAILDVADDGPGVRPELRNAVFERFRQLEGGATRRFGGTGLGLAIAKDFVELHGGSLSVTDAPEGGALFRCELPQRAPAGVVVDAPPADDSILTDEAAQYALDELRTRVDALATENETDLPLVLVVEDNPDMNRFVCETLAEDYRTESALDGKAGLEKAETLAPDLIVSDLMMPGLSGDQLVREIRRRRSLDCVPILLLTAKADDDLRASLLKEGAQDYVTKPFSIEELRARVTNLVTIKRTREILQRELDSQLADLEKLAREATHRKRELQTALESMRLAREQAEGAVRMKTDFLSMVSHELRTPLTTLKIQLERLRAEYDDGDADVETLLGRMTKSTERLHFLIDGLLHYARVQGKRPSANLEEVDAVTLARDVVEELRPEANEKGLKLELIGENQAPPVWTDPRLARTVLVNLVSNAVKFTEHGEVRVSVTATADGHRFAISDTGPGIGKAEQIRIFEPFEHAEFARKKHLPGIGLGLALVREMVGSLNGTLELASALGSGSTFTVVLPNRNPAQKRQGPS